MWTPLPQVLEECLHKIYEDRGWDMTTGINRRLLQEDSSRLSEASSVTSTAFPTLTDLISKVDEVTQQL